MTAPPITGADGERTFGSRSNGVQLWNPARADGPSVVYAASAHFRGGLMHAMSWCVAGEVLLSLSAPSFGSRCLIAKVNPGGMLMINEVGEVGGPNAKPT